MKIVKVGEEKFQSYWDDLWRASKYQYPLHSLLWCCFYKEQLNSSKVIDKSFVIVKENVPLCLILMTELNNETSNTKISWYRNPAVISIEKKILTRKEKMAIRKIIQDEVVAYLKNQQLKAYYLDLMLENRISLLSDTLLENNFEKKIVFTRMVDLKNTEKVLTAGLRKSYKGEIKWGNNNLRIEIITSENVIQGLFDDFRVLHVNAAGRETRSNVTWDLMFQMTEKSEAFCVLGYYHDALVSAAFFPMSKKFCFYGVSASNRDMWDIPLSHALVWNAILYAKKIGCEFFELGEVKIANTDSTPDEQEIKELNISKFKAGFGGEKVVRIGLYN